MGTVKVYTLEELKAIYEAEKPKYLGLKSPGGTFEVVYNGTKISNDTKWKEIEKALKKKTLPSGIYYLVSKANYSKNTTEHVHPVGVGNYSLADVDPEPIKNRAEKIQSIWTPDEAVKIISEKNRLEYELTEAKKKIQDLEEHISELEEEISQAETTQELSEEQKPGGWIEKIIELGTPLVNKYFEQRDQEIKLLSQKLNSQSQSTRKNPDDPEYMEYLQKIIQNGGTIELETEMLYLKNNYPAFYFDLCKMYEINPN